MSQKFLLKWNNHMNMVNEFKDFLSLGIMVDVTLACDGQSLKAHKIILSACSTFFRSLFLENPCKHPIVILKDIKYTELKAIIDFMYCGEVYVAEKQIPALIKVAQTLKVKGLGEVERQNDEFGYESEKSSDDECEDPSSKKSENHPDDETLSGQSSRSSINQLNKEFHQNHSDSSSSLVLGTSTHVSSEVTVTDNQQPSTSSASSKRPSKKSVHRPLPKRVKIVKNSSRKSLRQPHNLREPEVLIISDSNLIKDHAKIKDSNSVKNGVKIKESNSIKDVVKIKDSKSTIKTAKNEVKLHECKTCPFKTVCQKSLKSHINSRHPETKRIKCGQCGFVAYGKWKIEQHNAVHKKGRPYPCSLCTYKFRRNVDLKKHVKQIHKLDRLLFNCQKCDFSAADQGSIKKHMTEIHEKIPAIVIEKLPEVMNKAPEVISKLPEEV